MRRPEPSPYLSIRPTCIYLIGSLRNPEIPYIANRLRAAGFDVFDDWFAPGPEADEKWQAYETTRGRTYKEALGGWAAKHIFEFDKCHVDTADIGLLLTPAGKSGHLELGYMLGCGKPSYVLFNDEPARWDVMYQFAWDVFFSEGEMIDTLSANHSKIKYS